MVILLNKQTTNKHPKPVGHPSANETPEKKEKPNNIHIATLNTLSLRTAEKLLELEIALGNIKWDILGMREVRRKENCIEEYDNYILYYIGETKGHYGLGFMVKKYLKKQIIEFKGISERIALLNIQLQGYKNTWAIVQIYAPTEAVDETIKDKFYNQLTTTLGTAHKNVIVMGDFNEKIGKQKHGEETVIGNHGIGTRSKNGKRIVNLALENNITILNSAFNKRNTRKWTWISPDGTYRNEIDFISNQPKFFQDVRLINNFNFNSNHRMVRAVLFHKQQKKQRKHFHQSENTCTTDTRSQYNLTTGEIDKTQEIYNIETNDIYRKNKTTKNKHTLSSKTKDHIQKRKELLKNGRNKTTLREITELSKEISRNIRQGKSNERIKCIQKHIIKTGGISKALKELKETTLWESKNSKDETRRQPILKIATDFYRKLYFTENTLKFNINLEDKTENIPSILEREVQHAIETQKK
ncbi:uncharacterized protein LOC123654859 [Melitaea cinxia]|uniref:uncharacterized protein LOC123654859 n=1 Tax=Melitaea cinxia TaxID=113334 RepID=UPI001E274475|nr:uncharacterized protein LOC123654859 [Melitaea cinxia]